MESVQAFSQLGWEKLMCQTSYGRYADRVESEMIKYVLHRHSEPGVLLDIGCEGGRWSTVFADRRWQVIAIDVDSEALGICQARIPNARCVLADPEACRLAVEGESIDVALCVEVGPVIHRHWAVPEFARALKIGGYIVGVCWNRSSWRGLLYHHVPLLRSGGSNPWLGYPIRYRDFREKMTKHGFRFRKELGYAWGPFRRTSDSFLVSCWGALERFSRLQHLISAAPMIAFVAQKIGDGSQKIR